MRLHLAPGARSDVTTVQGAAGRLRVSQSSVSLLIRTGALSTVMIDGRKFIPVADIEKFLAANPNMRKRAK